MENFDRENIDKLLEIRQIRQYFPPSKFLRRTVGYSYPQRILSIAINDYRCAVMHILCM